MNPEDVCGTEVFFQKQGHAKCDHPQAELWALTLFHKEA
jgi:hypothetical protein